MVRSYGALSSSGVAAPSIPAALLLLLTALPSHAAGPEGIAAVAEAGKVNGIALACSNGSLSLHLKKTVIEIVPKTPELGAKFEEATQQGFLAQTKEPACPDPVAQKARADKAIEALRAQFPVGSHP